MAEMVGGAFLNVVFQKLFEQLGSPELRKNSLASKLKELEEKLKKAKILVDDAEDKQLVDEKVKEWLDELKHVVFMADDLVEEISNSKKEKKSKRRLVTTVIKSVYHSLAKTVQGEIDLIMTDLDFLLDQARVLELKHVGGGDAQRSRFSPRFIAPLREEHYVFGREAEKEEILELLLSDQVWGEDKIGVLPIVGMGGLGKTTLAQLVYDDKKFEGHGFSLKAWVTVSTEFDFCRIIKQLLQKINPEMKNYDVNDPDELQRLMREALRGKKFLFVFDDVWEESYDNWDLLMSNLTVGDRRSRVIVTTRSRDVQSIVKTGPIYDLKQVGDEDCWSIFVHHAFNGDTNADLRLQETGRRIVEKCKGHPLAVKSIGGLLRSERNPQKWENILRSHVWEWSRNQRNGVLPSLWLSYRYLPSSLKQCFVYCAVFPQDYEFDKRKTVLLWMAEGFLPSDEKENKTEEVGEQYFDDLISRSFFQRSSRDESRFVMHDLVHDLAAFVSGEFSFRYGEDSMNSKYLTIRTRHLSCSDILSEYDFLTNLSVAKHLRTFIASSQLVPLADYFVNEMVTKVRYLRVLSLFSSSVVHLSLGDLKQLRFLDLSRSNIEEVPDSICSLFNLQTLLLSNCQMLTSLPTDMGKLINLRHLDTSGTRLTKMPPKMGELKELRILSDFVLGEADGSGCSSLKELGQLRQLGGKLRISKLQNLSGRDLQTGNILSDKSEIRELILEWEGYTSNKREVDVLDALRPHTNLENLDVYSYPGSSFPIWVGEASFSKMVSVKLRGTGHLRGSLPALGQLPSLRELLIEEFHGVEKIGCEFYGNNNCSVAPFPCLETLEFWDMKSWKDWSFIGRDGNKSECFPCLKHLRLVECPKLGPESLLESGTLETLHIWGSYYSMECFPMDKFPKLKSLSLNGCINLKSLTSNSTDDHSLTSLEIQDCPEMESFLEGGLPPSLKSLDIQYSSKLVAKNSSWDLQKLTSLASLSINDCDAELDSFPEGLLPAALTSITLQCFPYLKSLNAGGFRQLKSLEKLSIWKCNDLESLPEHVLLPSSSLYFLEIAECPFVETRYQRDRGDKWNSISHIPQIHIWGTTTRQLEFEEWERRQSKSSASENI